MKKKQPEITHDEWIRGLIPTLKERPPDSFTVIEAVKATGRKRSTVVRHIMDMVESGELIKHEVNTGGRKGWAYTVAPKNKK